MNKRTCIIIEDEPLAMERTKEFVCKVPFLTLNATFDNALEGLEYLKSQQVDVLFLDINMDELSGIELLESSSISSQVIITTAYSEYALKGYELNVSDYLLKPFTFNRFLQAVNKAHDNLALKDSQDGAEYIFVKTENRLEKIQLDELLFIEGMRDYRRIHCTSKRIMTLQTFTDLEHMIPNTIAMRVHKSYIVALNKIDAIERGKIRVGEKNIPISATYRSDFFMKIKQ